MSELIRAGGFLGFRPLVEELGGDPDALLIEVGIDPARLEDYDAYIPTRKFSRALELAAKSLDCPDFGMRVASYVNIDVLGPIAVAMESAETVREGVQAARRYMHFHNTALLLNVREHAEPGCDFIMVQMAMRPPVSGVQLDERVLTAATRLFAMLIGPSYRPKEVHIRHQPFAPLAAYRQAFSVTPMFGAAEDGLLIARDMIDVRHAAPNPQLKRIAEYFLETAAPKGAGLFAPRARAIVDSMMRSGESTQAGLATALGLHERTLQRRLKDEGTTFEVIKDDVRRDLARTYLAQKGVPFSHIAEMLGYAEASAFTRAVRRWFGKAPREMRKDLAA